MGSSKKHQIVESEGKKWVATGDPVRVPLRPISTKPAKEEYEEDDDTCSTTPTAKESKIPERWVPPAAPRKPRPASTCHGVREFFTPPDLESVFKRHVERAN
ncbi:hypothetical protein LguiB_008755 [Lonicera macranthoides]